MWVRHGTIFNKHHAQLPVIDEMYDGTWRIFYSTRINRRSVPMFIITKAFQPQCILSEPKAVNLPLGELGTFDVSGIMPISIMQLTPTIKYMYYLGWSQRIDVPSLNTIGLAVEENGVWRKYSDGPVLGITAKQTMSIGGGDIFKYQNLYYFVYGSCVKWIETENDSKQQIFNLKYATSKDGIEWEPQSYLLNLESNIRINSVPTILQHNNELLIWYSSLMHGDNYKIRCLKGPNIFSLQKKQEYDLLEDNSTTNENIMVSYPRVKYINNTIHMLYNGNSYGAHGIQYATLSLV